MKIMNENLDKPYNLKDYKYVVYYECNNSTYGDDFLLFANEIGAIKVVARQVDHVTRRAYRENSIFYAVKCLDDAQKLVEAGRMIPGLRVSKPYPIDWADYINVHVDDYLKGTIKIS